MSRSIRSRAGVVIALVACLVSALPAQATAPTEPSQLLIGRWVPYSGPSSDEGDADLWIAGFDGTLRVRLTNTPRRDEAPGQWAPDGSAIVFESGPWYGQCNVRVIRPDGTGAYTLAGGASNDYAPKWSPDGRWISWIHVEPGTDVASLRVAHPDGTGMYSIAVPSHHVSSHVWSPDGTRIAFSSFLDAERDSEIFTVRPDGSGLRRVTFTLAHEHVHDWSPNGSRLLFSRAGPAVSRLSTIRPDGSRRRTLELTTVYGARYAPSGDVIAYEAAEGGSLGFSALWNRTRDGTATKVLAFRGSSWVDTAQCG